MRARTFELLNWKGWTHVKEYRCRYLRARSVDVHHWLTSPVSFFTEKNTADDCDRAQGVSQAQHRKKGHVVIHRTLV